LRGTRANEQRVAFRETLRAIVAAMPEVRDFNIGSTSGEVAGYRWRADIAPFPGILVDPDKPAPWEPEAVVISVQSPTGQILQISTVRLRKRPVQ